MFDPPTLPGSCSAISSPGSGDGPTPCGLPAGQMTDPSGPEAVLVSRGAWRAKARVSTIPAIFGRPGSGSSSSDALQRCLESRLRTRMDGTGSTLFALRWKRTVTPSGRSILQRLAVVRRTDAHDCILWVNRGGPTPTSGNGGGNLSEWGGSGARDTLLRYLTRAEVYGPLNPDLPCWLMGFPPAWNDCAATAMPSSRKSPRRSSKRISQSIDEPETADAVGQRDEEPHFPPRVKGI